MGKYKRNTWVDESNPPLSAQNLNNIENGIEERLPLDGGTMTGELILSGNPTKENGAATKKYVDETRREPWNVDDHLGYITDGNWYGAVGIKVTKRETKEHESLPIYMKNSGKIYLCLSVGKTTNVEVNEISVRINGETVETCSDAISNNEVSSLELSPILLDVKKGDLVTVYLKGSGVSSTTNTYTCTVGVLGIKANVDTPYIYLNFKNVAELT